MAIMVTIPGPLQSLTSGRGSIKMLLSDEKPITVRRVIEALEVCAPGMKDRIVAGGKIRPSVRVFVDGEDVKLLTERTLGKANIETGKQEPNPLDAEMSGSAEVVILPATAGKIFE
jgi:hypothetical protein